MTDIIISPRSTSMFNDQGREVVRTVPNSIMVLVKNQVDGGHAREIPVPITTLIEAYRSLVVSDGC